MGGAVGPHPLLRCLPSEYDAPKPRSQGKVTACVRDKPGLGLTGLRKCRRPRAGARICGERLIHSYHHAHHVKAPANRQHALKSQRDTLLCATEGLSCLASSGSPRESQCAPRVHRMRGSCLLRGPPHGDHHRRPDGGEGCASATWHAPGDTSVPAMLRHQMATVRITPSGTTMRPR
jgi:hypothetical protein